VVVVAVYGFLGTRLGGLCGFGVKRGRPGVLIASGVPPTLHHPGPKRRLGTPNRTSRPSTVTECYA